VACLLQWSVAECWIPEVANGNGDLHGKAFVLPEDGRTACRTEMKVSALSLSAVRVHAAVSPAEETARAKRAWLLMPPYRAGIIAPALLCRLGNQAAIFDSRAPLILRLATVAKWPTPKADLFPAKRLPRGLSGKEVYDLATRPASSFASAAPTDSACTSFSTSEPLNCRSPSVGAS
jgi:hypothetical protein